SAISSRASRRHAPCRRCSPAGRSSNWRWRRIKFAGSGGPACGRSKSFRLRRGRNRAGARWLVGGGKPALGAANPLKSSSVFLVFVCDRCSIRATRRRNPLGVRVHGIRVQVTRPRSGLVRACCLVFLGALGSVGSSDFAQGADLDDDDTSTTASTLPNIYLDLRTIYSRVPA